MLDKNLFVKGMSYLKLFYIKWDFDLDNNDLVLNVWYGSMSNLSDKMFNYAINQFTKDSEYPPRSPNDLLKRVKSMSEWLLDMELDHRGELGFNPILKLEDKK